MHVEMTYADGSTEVIPVTLEADRVASGRRWIPGHAVGEPSTRAPVAADFFCAALDEGQERSGTVEPIDEEEAFSWRLVGTEREHCLERLRHWVGRMGEEPFRTDAFLACDDGLVPLQATEAGLSRSERRQLTSDVQVIHFYVDDVVTLVDEAVAVGLAPSGP